MERSFFELSVRRLESNNCSRKRVWTHSLLILLAIIIPIAFSPVKAADPVVAVVDGQKFTYSQVMEAKSILPHQYQSESEEKLFPLLLNQVIATYVVNKEAEASGLTQKPEIQKAIDRAKDQIIFQRYLFGKVKDSITDASIQAKYNEVIKKLPQEKEIHLKHILVEDKNTAVSVLKVLQGGADFKTLAQSKSKDRTAKEGDLGFIRRSVLPEELAEATFKTAPGSYVKAPVKTNLGWHILKIEGVREAKVPPLKDIKEKLKEAMMQEAIGILVKDLTSKAKIELYDKEGKPLPVKAPSPTVKAS